MAISLYQATLPVPGSVIPNDAAVERVNVIGEAVFDRIGCATCHATLPLTANSGPPGATGLDLL
jgi:mono/diheme cytochrome c family protein